MKQHWAVLSMNTPIRKVYRDRNVGFTVKHCCQCGYAWELENGKTIIHSGFPKIGLVIKKCKQCKEKNNE